MSGKLDTMLHIERVRNLLNLCVTELLKRGELHDQSKLESPEVELFEEYGPLLKQLTYNSPEYHDSLAKLKPALEHHYARNSHHPEHYKNGVDDMDLFDVMEMFVDWKAASERQHNGNLLTSIAKNANRFNLSSQLVKIFENTAKTMDNK